MKSAKQAPPYWPEITIEDTRRAAALLKLPVQAFSGEDGTDPRQDVLKSASVLDIAACPGSGKTTLLVAKLAIMAEKWRRRTHGICVLSHTNAARDEIENRLGSSSAGARLLSYPHFVGTIHGFVDEFLALPWLRSLGFPISRIDSEICEKRRWFKLSHGVRYALEKKFITQSTICLTDINFGWGKKSGSLNLRAETDTYRGVQQSIRETTEEGYHCYDDIFVWANDLARRVPSVVEAIRDRFPILFIDEAQDNSEKQSEILYRLFCSGKRPVARQRLGDNNQAIFDHTGATGATTDEFPEAEIQRDLPNSHRFGQDIANLADPLGVQPYSLVGQGPNPPLDSGAPNARHSVFLFDQGKAPLVLEAYGHLLLETFSDRELSEGAFTAVGHRHQISDTPDPEKFPMSVGDYWRDYDPGIARREPSPPTFVHCVQVAQAQGVKMGQSYPAVENISSAFLRLAGMLEDCASFGRRKSCNRHVLRLLEESVEAQKLYREFLVAYAVDGHILTRNDWEGRWRGPVTTIAEVIARAGTEIPLEAEEFLGWNDAASEAGSSRSLAGRPDNIFRYSGGARRVEIQLGSIHSIKGETHSATLVLETFWHKHNLDALRPWLTGERSGWKSSHRARQKDRLRVHYVAMTRPKYLVCLAMPLKAFRMDNGNVDAAAIESLNQHGWEVQIIADETPPS